MAVATGKRRIEGFLRDAGVEFESHKHPLTYTAQAVAEAEHVPGKTVAKVVMALAGGELVMTVVPAPYRLDLLKLAAALGTDDVRLAHENEFADRFAGCDVGAMPPIGRLYGVATFVDQSLAEDQYIVFQAGTHTDTIRLKYGDYVKVAEPTFADIIFHG